MDILEIMKARHSVRQYSEKKIESGKREELTALVKAGAEGTGAGTEYLLGGYDTWKKHRRDPER